MATLGATAPLVSVTVPTIVAVVCAQTAETAVNSKMASGGVAPGLRMASPRVKCEQNITEGSRAPRKSRKSPDHRPAAGEGRAKTARLLPTARPSGRSEERLIKAAVWVTGSSIARDVDPPPSRFSAL